MRRSVIGESWLTNADAKRVNVLVRFEISPLRRSAHLPGAVVLPDDNPDRAGEPRGGAALARSRRRRPRQAGRDARGRQSSARAPAISKIAPPGRNARMGPAAALVGRIWPRRSSRGAARRLAARAPTRPGADGRSRRIVRHSPRGRPYRANSKLPRATRSSGSMAADAGLAQGRCTRTPRFTAPCPGSGRRLAVQRRAPLTLRSECLALGHANANGTVARIHGRSAGRHCPDATSRTDAVVALSREGTPCPSRPGDDATWTLRRDAAGRAAALRHTLHCGHAGCATLQPLQQVPTDCGLLQRAVVCCNGRHCIATGCDALRPVVMRCNRLCTLCCDRAVRA